MKFKEAIDKIPALATAYRPGLQALKSVDSQHLSSSSPRRLAGSVDLDRALCNLFPNAHRWDYAVGIKTSNETDDVIWVEVHPATTVAEIGIVLVKLLWLKAWAKSAAPLLLVLTREYVWIASGSVGFSHNSPQRKKIAKAGIRFAGRHFNLS